MGRAFVAYGLLGWCAEILWTALYDFISGSQRAEGDRADRVPMTRAERLRLQGRTYLWMFPIYGSAAFLFNPAHDALRGVFWVWRGILYMIGIFIIEAITGLLLKAITGRCPWDYSYARWHVGGVIRLDYAPVWFAFGMILERVHDYVRALP